MRLPTVGNLRGSDHAALTVDAAARAQAKLGARWAACVAKHALWSLTSAAQLGGAIADVVDSLDAPHLRPTGIVARLRDGVDAAAFGAATLVGCGSTPHPPNPPAAPPPRARATLP